MKSNHKAAAVHLDPTTVGAESSAGENGGGEQAMKETMGSVDGLHHSVEANQEGKGEAPIVDATAVENPASEGSELLEDQERTPSKFEDLMKLEFEPDFAGLRRPGTGASLAWHNIFFSVGDREILRGLSGRVESTELCALLGPSGAGKSSLLNILAGRISSQKNKVVSGSMSVNGEVVNPQQFRKHVSYVLQEDSLFATSTAREALEFSAKLRLPRNTSDEERKRIVDQLLLSLGLSHVADTMCGSDMVRGLSGGEKKRVSIGVELVTNPRLLFLDEPTSGLDSYSAYQVISVLRALARSGCAVLCTIHQPSSEIFSVFDKCITLANGKIMYQGAVATLPANLAKLGFPMPALTNPADFVMVLAQTKSDAELPEFDEAAQKLEQIDGERAKSNFEENSESFASIRAASVWTQMSLLALREFRNLGRDKGALIGRVVITTFLNLLFGFIFFQAADLNQPDYFIYSHFGALTNIFISALFGASQPPLLTFPLERVVFLREYATGTYSSAPYFLSKLIVELPMYLFTSLLIMVISYWLIGFNAPFIILALEVFLLQIVSASYAFLLGAIVSNVKQAQELAPLVFVPQLLFTGFFIRLSQIPEAIRWVQYLCSLKYGLNLAMISEFGADKCYQPSSNITIAEYNRAQCHELLDSNDVDPDLAWLYIVILLMIFLAFRTGSLIALIVRARNFSS